MAWLTPSVIATLVGTAILTFTYFYLYLQDKKRYMGTWTLAWAVYCLRYVFMLMIILTQKTAFLLICNQMASLISGTLLLIGSYQFINKRFPLYLFFIFFLGTLWIIASVIMDFSFSTMSLPTFSLLAAIYIWMGLLFLKYSSSQKMERGVVGITFLIWGVHKANYPFLRPVVWLAPWGYLLGAAFEMIVALGLLMIYFKKTKDDLADSEQQLKGIYDTADNIAFVSTDLGGENTRIIDINPGGEKIFNCTRNEIIGQKATIFHPQDALEDFVDMQARLVDNKKGYSKQTILIRKDGKVFPALHTLHPRFDTQDRIIGTLEVTIDLSQQKLIEDEIQLQSMIIRRMSEGVYLVRKDGIIVYTNPKFEEMFGYEPGEMIGKYATITQKNPREDMPKIVKHLEKNVMWQGEVENIKKDGTIFWSYTSVVSFNHSKHGDVVVAVHLDISDQKRAEGEKQELESKLRQTHKMEAVGTLSGGIAHEFNNILGIILGNAELAMDDASKTSSTYDFLQEIKSATLRGKNIVQQLLSFSRKESQQKQTIDIKKTINDAIDFLRASIPTSIEFKKTIAPDCHSVLGNKTQIDQVIINLCNNAAQSMEENGGVLSICLKNTTLKEKLISLDHSIEPGNYICLIISDTGHGIPKDIIDHIFDPFYTTKAVDKGSGMGLAVVHGIMKAHNGIIRILSEINQGTTCECYFPAIPTAPPENDQNPLENIQTGTETILFVDDETALVQTGRRMLERLGYKVFTQTNPSTALDFFQSSYHEIDLVITDMTMPQMTGDNLIKKLLTVNPKIKTIISTGYSSKIDEKTAAELGSNGYIMKPITLSGLSQVIRNVLDE